jgi:glutathione S-transferase
MSLVFYYSPMSTAVTTHWQLEELGIPYEKVRIDLATPRTPEFLAINPNGKVPVIVHDGVPIVESAAIAIYLGETFGVAKKLFPEAGPRRGQAMQWIVWSNVSLGEPQSRLQHASSPRLPAEQHNAKTAEVARGELHKMLGVLDGAVAKSPYLLGDAFTLADAHVASWTSYLAMTGVEVARWKHVEAFTARCSARPAFKVAHTP